jgi:hypothetical protein
MSVLESLNVVDGVRSLAQMIGSLQIDDSSISVLAMLLGIIAGWTLTGLHQKMKAQRVRISRRRLDVLRKPD